MAVWNSIGFRHSSLLRSEGNAERLVAERDRASHQAARDVDNGCRSFIQIVTQSSAPSGVTATDPGCCPTAISLRRVFVAKLTSKTVPEMPSVANSSAPFGAMAMPPVTGCSGLKSDNSARS